LVQSFVASSNNPTTKGRSRTMAKTTKTEKQTLHLETVKVGAIHLHMIGGVPGRHGSELVLNRMSEKAKFQLLAPGARKNEAERRAILKHEVYEEFRAAAYHPNADEDTYLGIPAPAFKGVLATAALDTPGATKAQIGRLTWVVGPKDKRIVGVYGIPKLFMQVVRSSGINKAPDIRTRPILPEWAAHIIVNFQMPLLDADIITTLSVNGGFFCGVGDGRQEKGKLSFGQYELVPPTDADYKRIVKEGNKKAQIAAMADPQPFDEETDRLLAMWKAMKEKKSAGKATTTTTSLPAEAA